MPCVRVMIVLILADVVH